MPCKVNQVERADWAGGTGPFFRGLSFRKLGWCPLSCTGSAKAMRIAHFLRIICKVTAIKGEASGETGPKMMKLQGFSCISGYW